MVRRPGDRWREGAGGLRRVGGVGQGPQGRRVASHEATGGEEKFLKVPRPIEHAE